jgi:DNA-binding NtrC family response regulator
LPLTPKKVLVGDSDPIVLALTSHILNRRGYEAHPIAHHDEFLEHLRAGDYDAAVVDAFIEGAMDAILAAPSPRDRIIVTTHEPDAFDGVFATLRKPLEFGQLVDTVQKCVEGE